MELVGLREALEVIPANQAVEPEHETRLDWLTSELEFVRKTQFKIFKAINTFAGGREPTPEEQAINTVHEIHAGLLQEAIRAELAKRLIADMNAAFPVEATNDQAK